MRNIPANTKVREGEEGESAPSAGAGISLQPTERTTMEWMPTLQLVEEPTPEQTYSLTETAVCGEESMLE